MPHTPLAQESGPEEWQKEVLVRLANGLLGAGAADAEAVRAIVSANSCDRQVGKIKMRGARMPASGLLQLTHWRHSCWGCVMLSGQYSPEQS